MQQYLSLCYNINILKEIQTKTEHMSQGKTFILIGRQEVSLVKILVIGKGVMLIWLLGCIGWSWSILLVLFKCSLYAVDMLLTG